MNIVLVFYTRPESDEELFLSAHLHEKGARDAAEADARDQGFKLIRTPQRPNIGRGWRWGAADGRKNPNVSGDGTENPDILTDWSDPDESGGYYLTRVPLHGAQHIVNDIQHQCLRLLGEA